MHTLRRCVKGLFQSSQSFRCASSVAASTFKASELEVQLCKESELRPKPDSNKLIFGQNWSDHMLEVEWTQATGWGRPRISPIHNIQLHPSAQVFHYATELFEGTKAYRGVDNKIRLFRPELNMKRMNVTAERVTLPTFDGDELIRCIRKLVDIEKEWVPYSQTSTLYIRPTLIGTEACIGVHQSKAALLFVITGPVGPYYPTGFKPVSLLASPQFVRAWEGGCGRYKMGSNYGPTIGPQIEAAKNNCQQVLWLYGPDHEVTEVGTMNLFTFWINEKGEKELVTPSLDKGLILPGITRQSLLDLAREWGEFKVTERSLYMKEIVSALKEKRLKELFGAGTACIVCPIESILYDGTSLQIPTMSEGAPITMRFHKELTDIQYGRVTHSWARVV